MVPSPSGPVPAATRVADEILFPNAMEIERAALVPLAYLDALAEAGLYGLFAPRHFGGFDASISDAARVIECLGGASLSAAFVWAQHNSAMRAVAASSLGAEWGLRLCRGEVRAGIAIAALRRPGPPALRAEAAEGGWILDGHSPWMTGWGRVDVCFAGARSGGDIVWLLVDARESPSLRARRLELAAVASTGTVELAWDRHFVGDERVVRVEAFADWERRDALGLRSNGYLAVGVAARAAALLGPSALDAEVTASRRDLDSAGTAGVGETRWAGGVADHPPADRFPSVVAARAKASLLAVRATSALVAAGGGRSMDLAEHAQRLAREAMFLLVFGQTRAIREAQLAVLAPA